MSEKAHKKALKIVVIILTIKNTLIFDSYVFFDLYRILV